MHEDEPAADPLVKGFRRMGFGKTKGYQEVAAGRIRPLYVGKKPIWPRRGPNSQQAYLDMLAKEQLANKQASAA